MDRDDLASLDHLSEPQATDERIDVSFGRHGGAEQGDQVADERVDGGGGGDHTAVGPDPGHGGPPSGADEPSGGPAAPPALPLLRSTRSRCSLASRAGGPR